MSLSKTTQMNVLLDFYGQLLTEKQRLYLVDYYREDLSLGEIAEIHGISRQAVYDQLKRSESILLKYEERLKLVEQFHKRQDHLALLAQYVTTHYREDQTLNELIQRVIEDDQ